MLKLLKRGSPGAADLLDTDEVEALAAAIETTKRAGIAALADAERLEALAVTETDDERGEALARDARSQRRAVLRAEYALVELVDQLETAKWQRTVRNFEHHRWILAHHAEKVKAAAKQLAELNAEACRLFDAGRNACGPQGEGLPRVAYAMGLCLPDVVAHWSKELDATVESVVRRELVRAPKPRLPTEAERAEIKRKIAAAGPAPTGTGRGPVILAGGVPYTPEGWAAQQAREKRPVSAGNHAVRLDQVEERPPQRPRNADDTQPLLAGEVRVRALRPGWSPAADRPQCDRGQVVRMQAEGAKRAMQAGAVEIVEDKLP
jgi:hypothetical protein